ncbi:c-type cytochrome [Lichenicoccus sp.]|uniref:c-type cytochrome n=1 Tax=Lichenicoccus sp. TaxID=2781899 RepID=UPI003D0ABEEA
MRGFLQRAIAPLAFAAVLLGARAEAQAPSAGLVARGRYVAIASDCMPCHTAVGGKPYAGGLILNTAFGRLATPNITPDKATGIGTWTEAQFYRAMHKGVGPGHRLIFPVMPFPSYTRLPRTDVDALRAYLMSRPAVHAPRLPVTLNFPFNIRLMLRGWRLLYFRPRDFRDDPSQSAQWNRGAYLVEGPGHCGECHSPRNALGGMVAGRSLAGGMVDGFLASNISSDPRWGIGGWSQDALVDFLSHGSNARGVVFGPMTDVVHASLGKLTAGDVKAIAFYLKHTPPRPNLPTDVLAAKAAQASVASGRVLYASNCAPCHQADGAGVTGAIPNLAGNDALRADDPADAVMPMLAGLKGQGDYGAMPPFDALSDANIADIANYIRDAWSNAAPANATPASVHALRASASISADGSTTAGR